MIVGLKRSRIATAVKAVLPILTVLETDLNMHVRAIRLLVRVRRAVLVQRGTISHQVAGPMVTRHLNNVKRGTDVVAVAARNVQRVHMQLREPVLVATVALTNIQRRARAAVRHVQADMEPAIIQPPDPAVVRSVPPVNTGTAAAVPTVALTNIQRRVPLAVPGVRRVRSQ